jgi:hypothetical protein
MSISDFFRINGIDTPVEQYRILDTLELRYPVPLWARIHFTPTQERTLQAHGYLTAVAAA